MKKFNIEKYADENGHTDYQKLIGKDVVFAGKIPNVSNKQDLIEARILDWHSYDDDLYLKLIYLSDNKTEWRRRNTLGDILFVYDKEEKADIDISDWLKDFNEAAKKAKKTEPYPWEKFPPMPYTPPPRIPYPPYVYPRPCREQPNERPHITCEDCGFTTKEGETIGYYCNSNHCPLHLGGSISFCGTSSTH